MTIAGSEGSFVFVPFSDSQAVESITDVQSGELLFAFESIEEFGDKGERVTILDSSPIEGTIIDT